ncbi:MAG: heme exporter protein CcmD [Zhongshania sp.]|uniref:heme exporter protein CcmD n=1 Tax=Zhongshania sp. TaxID=1971902 RepID=UPI0026150771|nr:heme exporter protein CcmD [Zhongshania sp.]MDF1693401.1 heme exporter protein CcmD [Zhongshania sp.]
MYFDSLGDFLAMDGHGPYVWFCYGVTAVVLGGLLWEARRRRQSAEQAVRTVVRRKQASTGKE